MNTTEQLKTFKSVFKHLLGKDETLLHVDCTVADKTVLTTNKAEIIVDADLKVVRVTEYLKH